MASALDTLDSVNYHHGHGLVAMGAGTASGAAASMLIGLLYGKYRENKVLQHSPWMIGILGKLAALGIIWGSSGRWTTSAVIANDVGQAGINALFLNWGVKLGVKWSGKQITIGTSLLGDGTSLAGELPPAAPGRSLENISVEDLANLR